jgi:hypothetical protein
LACRPTDTEEEEERGNDDPAVLHGLAELDQVLDHLVTPFARREGVTPAGRRSYGTIALHTLEK